MSREKLSQLEDRFKEFIAPLLDERDAEDYRLFWEFQKFIHLRKLQALTAEHHSMKKWKELLLSR
jgi:hypothetical protein